MHPDVLEEPLTYEQERGKPMPSRNHAAAQMNIGVEFCKQPEFRELSEFTLEFEGRPYTPDLSLYPKQAVDWLEDEIRGQTPPLAVVEIFSPTQGYQNVMEKLKVYFRNGVKSCWLVSPHLKTITIIGPDGQEENFVSGRALDSRTGLWADVAAVFS
jgi:Uma2 family endonuclease